MFAEVGPLIQDPQIQSKVETYLKETIPFTP